MALNLPISTPLTESQSELNAKVSSMKTLLALSSFKKLRVPKHQQVSSYDYLKKLVNTLGFTLEPLFILFIEKVFDQAGDFLEKEVLQSVASSLAKKGTSLPNTHTPLADMTDVLQKQYENNNMSYLRNSAGIPANFLSVAKQKIAKDLVLMMFGPKDGPTAEYLNPDPAERQRLISEAICGSFAFSMSNDPIVREEDLEYNRIALAKQLERGAVMFNISCQDVHVTLPEDPSIIFEGGGQFTVPSQSITPAQSLSFLVQHVGNQVQNINREENRDAGGRSFFEIMIERMIGYMSTLITPLLGPVFEAINATPAGSLHQQSDIVHSTCDILNNPSDQEGKEFGRKLSNQLFKSLLSIMLIFVIREFKKLVANYYAKISLEKQKRKLEKIKHKFKMFDKAADKAQKAQRYASALSSLNSILQPTA